MAFAMRRYLLVAVLPFQLVQLHSGILKLHLLFDPYTRPCGSLRYPVAANVMWVTLLCSGTVPELMRIAFMCFATGWDAHIMRDI